MTPVLDLRRPPIVAEVAEDPAVQAVFSGRLAPSATAEANLSLVVGDGDVVAARSGALALIGSTLASAVFMEQVHGGGVAVVGAAERGRGTASHADAIAGVDALVTFEPDVAVVVLAADCVPVLLTNPGRGVAAVHAGRRGVQAQVVVAAVRALTRPGGENAPDASAVVALIGPAIGGCCYEVPATLRSEVAGRWPQAGGCTSWGSPSLDLPAAVTAQLAQVGVARVEQVGGCTHCAPARWFSHRATTGGGWAAGRQAGIVVRRRQTPPARPAAAASLDSA